MSPIIDGLSRQHPKMTFHVVSGGTDELYTAVAERRVEFAVCRLIGRLPDELAAEVLFHDAFAVMASVENPLTRKRKLDWIDLADEPWTFYSLGSFFGAVIAEAFRVNGLEPPRVTVQAESFIVQRAMLVTGRFLTVQPSFMVKLPQWGLRLKALPISQTNSSMPIGIITLKGRSLTPPAELFIGRLRAYAKSLASP